MEDAEHRAILGFCLFFVDSDHGGCVAHACTGMDKPKLATGRRPGPEVGSPRRAVFAEVLQACTVGNALSQPGMEDSCSTRSGVMMHGKHSSSLLWRLP
eukprot:jgi/Undpi1/3570/HiC_scaffold_16.g06942.m1